MGTKWDKRWSNFLLESYKKIVDFPFFNKTLPTIIKKIQTEYDSWEQDEDGHSEYIDPTSFSEIGSGGLCHVFADIIVKELSAVGVEIYSVSSCHEQHVYTVFVIREGKNEGVYQLDIPYSTYESGAGFTWRKKENVEFDENDFYIYLLDHNVKNLKDYTDEGFEDEYDD